MNDAMNIVEADALFKSLGKSVDQIERQILHLEEGYKDFRSRIENVENVSSSHRATVHYLPRD